MKPEVYQPEHIFYGPPLFIDPPREDMILTILKDIEELFTEFKLVVLNIGFHYYHIIFLEKLESLYWKAVNVLLNEGED
jgi:hypothetical protein